MSAITPARAERRAAIDLERACSGGDRTALAQRDGIYPGPPDPLSTGNSTEQSHSNGHFLHVTCQALSPDRTTSTSSSDIPRYLPSQMVLPITDKGFLTTMGGTSNH